MADWKKLLDASSGDIRRLSHVVRYSSIPVCVSENVAEHSYFVSLYALMIHQVMRPENTELIGAIVVHALLHDVAEAKTGDVVRTFKYSSEALKREIDFAEEKIIEGFDVCIKQAYSVSTSLSRGNEDYVKKVVKAADFLSLQQYMVREYKRGNQEIYPYFELMLKDLMSMSAIMSNDQSSFGYEFSLLYEEMYLNAKQLKGTK